jgi:hypothetical protein
MIKNCASRWSFTKNHNTTHSLYGSGFGVFQLSGEIQWYTGPSVLIKHNGMAPIKLTGENHNVGCSMSPSGIDPDTPQTHIKCPFKRRRVENFFITRLTYF